MKHASRAGVWVRECQFGRGRNTRALDVGISDEITRAVIAELARRSLSLLEWHKEPDEKRRW